MPASQDERSAGAAAAQPVFDTSVANPARIWDYWLGGKDHFEADRDAAEKVIEVLPTMPLLARLARRQLTDTVRLLAGRHGIRQFLDIGTGLPTADNTHEIAQRTAPEARIVYVDNDPVVISHARALLTSSPEGATDYLQADLRDTAAVLTGAARTLDFGQPVAVLLMGVLHFIPDEDGPYRIVARLMDATAPGSYLVIGHGASDIQPDAVPEMMRRYNERSSASLTLRTRDQVVRFFDGLELVGPGLVPLSQWWPADEVDAGAASGVIGYSGMARKNGGGA
ncbi:MAG TPA: SAM-dependent methyltransferase [Streptosporangiaceae bacterium]